MAKRLFVDMDGTLALWQYVPCEQLYKQGYYRNLKPHDNLLSAIKKLINEGIDVYILSSYLADSAYALNEKKEWLNQYLPEIKDEKRIFVKYGSSKSDYIPGRVTPEDYLIDDYTINLINWRCNGGTPIKFLNGINHTKKTWNGLKVDYNDIFLKDKLLKIFYNDKLRDIEKDITDDIY